MEDRFKHRFSDTEPELEVTATTATTATSLAAGAARPAGSPAPTAPEASADSPAVQGADPANPGDLWPEAADAKCSESAVLFSGTQPAPLSVV